MKEKTIDQLKNELAELNKRIAELEKSETHLKQDLELSNTERMQLASIFYSIDEPIYISTPDTYKVLYANQASQNIFGASVGRQCYEVFHGFKSPCPFCTNEHIFGKNLGKTYIWECQNQINKRWYRCVDKAIRWPGGRMVRYEVASGLCFYTSNLLKEGQKITIKTILPTPSQTAIVCWITKFDDVYYKAGLEFV